MFKTDEERLNIYKIAVAKHIVLTISLAEGNQMVIGRCTQAGDRVRHMTEVLGLSEEEKNLIYAEVRPEIQNTKKPQPSVQ